MKKALLSLALAALTVSSAFAALPGGVQTGVVTYLPAEGEAYNICEAYPVNSISTAVDGCYDNKCWTGVARVDDRCIGLQAEDNNILAVPGILCLGTRSFDSDGHISKTFDCNDFICIPTDCDSPFVQNCRLTKHVGPSDKCPATYGPGITFYMFGEEEIRTWWTLIYTSPNTTFTLEITGVCQRNGRPITFKTVWTWKVIATFDSLIAALDVMHQGALGTCEFPCISAEDMYTELRNQIVDLKAKVADIDESTGPGRQAKVDAQDLLFELESMLTGFCSFTDCFVAEECFSQQFPASDQVQFGDFGYTGIIDTIENPCACKLIADLEFLGEEAGIVSAAPTAG